MKKSITTLVSALIAATVVACSAAPLRQADIADPGELLFNGYVHSNIDCYECHSGDASGTWKGSNLIGIGKHMSRDKIIKRILAGPSIMPSYDGKLTDIELGDIADWLLSLEQPAG